MLRSPAVAGQFYPADKDALAAMVSELMPEIPPAKRQNVLAVISPHAGYIYSGGVAGQTFARVNIPEDVIILGPNHHGHGAPLALMNEGTWEMPMGPVSMNPALSELILKYAADIVVDNEAHRFEHSLEVQVPFLQARQANLKLAPIVVSRLSFEGCRATGQGLAQAIKELGRPVLMVASTDMSHYESRQSATIKDHLALDRITALDPQGLYEIVIGRGITMCGIMPTTIVLAAAQALGASKAELVRYSDSGETSGDLDQVVGYAGLLIS
ncbi:MAG: AmmeMemoRadiSam system protein B [Desulfobulbaceae bacterium]|nr:AmmeMemoRadiSam system protein B [Desulfobulbaceae bacterium]